MLLLLSYTRLTRPRRHGCGVFCVKAHPTGRKGVLGSEPKLCYHLRVLMLELCKRLRCHSITAATTHSKKRPT